MMNDASLRLCVPHSRDYELTLRTMEVLDYLGPLVGVACEFRNGVACLDSAHAWRVRARKTFPITRTIAKPF